MILPNNRAKRLSSEIIINNTIIIIQHVHKQLKMLTELFLGKQKNIYVYFESNIVFIWWFFLCLHSICSLSIHTHKHSHHWDGPILANVCSICVHQRDRKRKRKRRKKKGKNHFRQHFHLRYGSVEQFFVYCSVDLYICYCLCAFIYL